MPQAQVISEHVMETEVSGPDGANRLFICTGIAVAFGFSVSSGQTKTETLSWLVGPELSQRQFHRATAHATISGEAVNVQGAPTSWRTTVLSMEADWDDESRRVEARSEITANATGVLLRIDRLSFSIHVLAEVPPEEESDGPNE